MDTSDAFDTPQQQPQPQPQQQAPQQQQQHPQTQENNMTLPSSFLNNDMHIDNGEPQLHRQTEPDIDSLLLQQFSCLGTTDHEDLINQFQTFMNNEMNKENARFFLEMSNWNLQTAVCCYLDFFNYQPLPKMKIICETSIGPKYSWTLENNGTEDWPNGCYLLSPYQTKRLGVPSIRPGETIDIIADVPPPACCCPPIVWRICTPSGLYFGDQLWLLPQESTDTAADLANRMAQLRTTTATMCPENFPQIDIVISVNMN